MDEYHLKNVVEAVLFSVNEPISLEKLQEVFEDVDKPNLELIRTVLNNLKNDYKDRAFELVHLANGYQVQTKSVYSYWVSRTLIEKPAKYSRALLETLAIIAYKQPVTRADIEEIRGVAVNNQILKTLLEREWIRIAGRKDVPGRPVVYTTTKEFLYYFNLKDLNELPSLSEVLKSLSQESSTIDN